MFGVYVYLGYLSLSELADYGEFLGLSIAIGTLVYALLIETKLRKVARSVLFDNNLPQANKDLGKTNSDISNSLTNYADNIRFIRREMILCETILRNIKKQINSSDRKSVNAILEKIERIRFNRFDVEPKIQLTIEQKVKALFIKSEVITVDDIWDVYSLNNALIRQIDYSIKNHKKIMRYV